MVAQHTPGPWMVEPQPDMLGNDTEELVVRADRKEVCRLDPDMLEVPRSEWSGNANLIAAAPELLEALEEAANCSPGAFWLSQAKIVIAKARGGSA